MEDIEQRLKETTADCIKCYEVWGQDKQNEEARENLAEAIHELRKVASRLEIDIALSEREQMSGKPISIPSHRSQRKGGGSADMMDMDDDDSSGNMMPDSNESNSGQQRKPSRRPPSRGRKPGGQRGAE